MQMTLGFSLVIFYPMHAATTKSTNARSRFETYSLLKAAVRYFPRHIATLVIRASVAYRRDNYSRLSPRPTHSRNPKGLWSVATLSTLSGLYTDQQPSLHCPINTCLKTSSYMMRSNVFLSMSHRGIFFTTIIPLLDDWSPRLMHIRLSTPSFILVPVLRPTYIQGQIAWICLSSLFRAPCTAF
ncbi:hypothetical protein BS47DRAFT_1342388, partial [Hydnum rufescens UP504]